MRKWPMRTIGAFLCAVAAWRSFPASAANWDPAKVSSNFELVSLDDAELTARSIKVYHMGNLELTSGHIVAADPLVEPDRPPLVRTVQPGDYAVTLYEASGRIAGASLRFADGKPVRWELATIAGQDVQTLKNDEFFGYAVDAGLGCYMDADTYKLMQVREERVQAEEDSTDVNYYDDVVAPEIAVNDDKYVMHRPVHDKRGNVAIFWSGWGDGVYPVFWGLDANDRPLVLFTDFQVIENADGRQKPGAN
ncbi:MAG: DUF4241 domain-containing protein [Rhizobiaceae bacterium]|nr:DUF4241 domain-containing protein [Rhizobiaceae bacterium]